MAAFIRQHFLDANLDDGEAMVGHDAVRVAVSASTKILWLRPNRTLSQLPRQYSLLNYVPGASGPIAFDSDGNAIDKAIPILQLHADGTVIQKALAWPTGQPLAPASTC